MSAGKEFILVQVPPQIPQQELTKIKNIKEL